MIPPREMRERLSRFLGVYVSIVLALATVVGLYVGARAIDLTWLFFLVLVVGLPLAAGWLLRGALAEWLARFRNYPIVVAELRKVTDELKTTVAAVDDRLIDAQSTAFRNGVIEGRAQAAAIVLAPTVKSIPALTSITSVGNDVYLLATYQGGPLQVGAVRFRVVVQGSGELKGVVQVEEYDQTAGIVTLTCVERTSPEFWNHLASRAPVDPSPPGGVVLTAYASISLHDGMVEDEVSDEGTNIQ